MSGTTLLQTYGILNSLEVLSGATLGVVLLVLSILLFVGPYRVARKYDLGTAHAVGAGIGGLGFVFLFLIVVQVLHSPL
jgi:hypothetical protein